MKLPSLLIAAALSVSATSAFAQITPAEELTVTQSSTVAGTPSTFTLQFTSVVAYTSNSGVSGGYLDVVFPNSYTVGNTTPCSQITITIAGVPTSPIACTPEAVTAASPVAPQLPAYPNASTKIPLRLANGVAIPANGAVTIAFPVGLITATTAGTKAIRVDETKNATGLQRSEGTIAITAPAAPVPTMSEWAMILLGTILAGGAALYIQRRQLGV